MPRNRGDAVDVDQLGMTAEYTGERLLPVGTLYDPFVARALDALVYATYSDARFVLVGTPSGISLSREGGAHQSTITPSIGIGLPGLVYAEPAFAVELEWLLLDGLRRLQEPDGGSLYLRLSTKPIDQGPFAAVRERVGDEALRRDVLAGGFRLREPGDADDAVVIAVCGALVPEALAAADQLEADEGVAATVLCLGSPDRLYSDWQRSVAAPVHGGAAGEVFHLERLLAPGERGRPVVTVLDGASHSLAFVGAALEVPTVPLGVDRFGQVGSQQALYEEYCVSPEAIVTAALAALSRGPGCGGVGGGRPETPSCVDVNDDPNASTGGPVRTRMSGSP